MGNISEHFSYREFERSDTAEHLGIANFIPDARTRDAVQALVLNVLEPLRTAWGRPLVINSGYRNAELNKAVGGVPASQHCRGEAADVRCDRPYSLAVLAVQMGLPFDQMILYPTFVHFSHRLKGEQRGQILYNRTYMGPRL